MLMRAETVVQVLQDLFCFIASFILHDCDRSLSTQNSFTLHHSTKELKD